jgi:molybdate transport system permease protein
MAQAAFLSFRVGICSTLFCVAVGLPVAWLLARRRFAGRSVAEALTMLPLVLPPTVMGFYLLILVGRDTVIGRTWQAITGTTLVFSFWGIVLAASVGSAPLFIRQAQSAIAAVDPELEAIARVHGADRIQTIRSVVWPLARGGIFAGAALAFARSLGDFGATLMVGASIPGRTRTLALEVYDKWQSGHDQAAFGAALLLSGIGVAVVTLVSRLAVKAD